MKFSESAREIFKSDRIRQKKSRSEEQDLKL